MKCNKCESNNIKLERDSRGLPEARCADCGSLIKKMNTGEVIDFYEEKLAQTSEEKPMCRYCTENYVMLQGNMRTRISYVPIKAEYCPVCGRKLKADDRAY